MHEIRNVLYFLMLIHRFVSALIYTPKLTYKYKYSFAIHENIVSISFYKVGESGRVLFYVFSHLGEVFFHFYRIFTLDNIEERR